MLIDLQTSFFILWAPLTFSLPFLPLPVPLFFLSLSPSSQPRVTLQKPAPPSTKERTRPETLNPITIDQRALRGEGEKNVLT